MGEGAAPRDGPLRVVIADDHLVVRAGMRAVLTSGQVAHQVVAETADVAGTVEAVGRLRPDVLVLDLTMAGESSLPAVPALLAASPGTAVLVLTMQEDPAFARASLRAGAMGYLLKEAAAEELLTAVEEVGAGRAWVQPEVGARLAGPAREAAGGLTGRERDVLALIGEGLTNAEVADRLHVSLRTVESHRAAVRGKTGAATRAELTAAARRLSTDPA